MRPTRFEYGNTREQHPGQTITKYEHLTVGYQVEIYNFLAQISLDMYAPFDKKSQDCAQLR